MVDTEMTATPTQQPESLRLADALKMGTPYISGVSTIDQTEKELRRQHAEIARLTAELEKERTARQEAQAMAECLDMLRTDLIAAGVVGPEVAPMFLTEAVLSAVSLERTARIEAQQRLADMQELVAKSGLAHRMAVQRCVQAAVSEAVAEEREACEERVEDLYEKIETPYLVDITRAIHARDKA